MKSEIKTASILGIIIVGLIVGLSVVFASIESSNTSANVLDENKVSVSDVKLNIDKSNLKWLQN